MTEQKGISKEIYVVEKKSEASERIALHAIQKQLEILKYKEYLLLMGFIGAAALLRVPMQAIPSAEPISFFALLAGWLFGRKKGAIVGASALYLSNFMVMGGQGPWTIFQAAGFATIGYLGGFIRKNSTIFEIMTLTLIGTVLFEIIVNIGSIGVFPIGIIGIFLSALPFTIVHIFSNLLFAGFLPKTKKFVEKKGKFDEKEVCEELLKKFKNKIGRNKFIERVQDIEKI